MQRRAFTLVDVLLAISIVTILMMNSIAVATMFHNSTAIRTQQSIHLLLTEASTRARYSVQNSNWGAYIKTDPATNHTESVTLFAGNTYSTRITTYDETVTINQAITGLFSLSNVAPYPAGSGTEVVFEKGTGDPHQTGTITLTANSKTSTVTISPTGNILYER